MKSNPIFVLRAAFALAVMASSSALHASPDHAPLSADGHAHTHGEIVLASTGQAWATIRDALAASREMIREGKLEGIHTTTEQLSAALTHLQNGSGITDADKAKRADAAIRQMLAVTLELHTAGDAGDLPGSSSALGKLEGGVRLLAIQFDAPSMVPTQTHCPVSTRPLGSMGTPVTHSYQDERKGDQTVSLCCAGCAPTFDENPGLFVAKLDSLANPGTPLKNAEPTMKLEATSSTPLVVGQPAKVTVSLLSLDGRPVGLDDLMEAHTEKVHLLMIDASLTDYHHEHPMPNSEPGKYEFEFTPTKPGSYRIWADVVSAKTGRQEYIIGDLVAETKPEPMKHSNESLVAKVDGLTYQIDIGTTPPKVGQPIMGKLTIRDASGQIFDQLEPVMGAYAHIVGFSDDYKSIAHIHPMGPEPTKKSDRGRGELEFHLEPESAGILRLYAQIQVGGEDKFAPFTLQIQP